MIQKTPVNINFAQGLDTKTDSKQVSIGKFLSLQNTVFNKGGLLQKRNGFGSLAALPDNTNNFLTTFNGDLTAIGNSINAYSTSTKTWSDKGYIQPVDLSTIPLIRNNTNQSQCDAAVANGLVCTVYTDQNPSNLSNPVYKFAVADVTTGQNLIAPTLITASSTIGTPRVFVLGNYFIIVFSGATASHLQYLPINYNSLSVGSNTDISTTYLGASTVAFDGVVSNNSLFIAYNGSSTNVKVTSINSNLLQSGTVTFTSKIGTSFSVCADQSPSQSVIWVSFYNSGTSTGYSLALTPQLVTVLAPVEWTTASGVTNLTSYSNFGILTILFEVTNSYSYDSSIPSNNVQFCIVFQNGTVGSPTVFIRGVGLASKAFLTSDNTGYFVGVYKSPYQTTYFLLTAPVDNGRCNVVAKYAYGNGSGYLTTGLPSVSAYNSVYYVPYLYADQIQAVNKNTNVPSGSQTAGIYSQFGINLASFNFDTKVSSSETANNLNLTGGFMWSYDGYSAVENGFFLWPDSVEATWSTTGGSIHAQPDGATNTNAYYIQVTYEWTDNQGNAFRSAPSIPVAVTTTGSGTTGSITVSVPTLRQTYKTQNPVKIVAYRWSVAQQTYYQSTSITAPILNNTTVDSVSFNLTNSDAQILGNNIIYTNGGVVENISPPACSSITLFDDRLFLLSSEDGTVWYSKQVLENTPVEMSDLFTLYVAPTIGASGSTGNVSCMFPMDDKIILFKKDAIYYINGSGPDNTGANSQYSQPIFVTSTVGTTNQQSIVFTPLGLMFQSDKGIWLLGRDLSTTYIGAPVEAFNSATVESSLTVPATNQVRFTLDSGITIVYDYYYNQWSTFVNIPGISSTIFQGLHTYINSNGQTFQETPNAYLDGSNPVLISFTTSWINIAGLQGYQRIYFFYILGQFLSPHKLVVNIAYDYAAVPTQQSIIQPNNFSGAYGNASPYGQGSPYGGPSAVEQWRIDMTRQTCETFQISIAEFFDPAFGTVAGAGLTLSGINAVVGMKKGYLPIRRNSVG